MFKKSMIAILACGLGVGLFIGCGGGSSESSGGNDDTIICNTLPRTGQTIVHAANDDGDYQKGVDRNFTRDDSVSIVTDYATNLLWDDASSLTKTWSVAIEYCKDFTLGGFNDWRLPTVEELYFLADKERVTPSLDPAFDMYQFNRYWTISIFGKDPSKAYVVWFDGGKNGSEQDKGEYSFIRCVRGESTKPVFKRDDVKHVVNDETHCLMWQDDVEVISNGLTWTEALEYCENLTLADYDNWRLPNIHELYVIFDRTIIEDSVIDRAFKNFTGIENYWSSTSFPSTSVSFAARMVQSSGDDNEGVKTAPFGARCVRDNKWK